MPLFSSHLGFKDSAPEFESEFKRVSKKSDKPLFQSTGNQKFAIWHTSNMWVIGYVKSIGERRGKFFSNSKNSITDKRNTWKYWKNNHLVAAGATDIEFKCKRYPSK